ncbi:hypothetical protein DUI87_07920 [Hirundo rustica rustica]|uniref:Uncharacterized protein n=1 Tax=Hirundo rustica rustica TaxID=333673 RepID=A0A3M0L8Z5_HIRRU|nr:hypothetical protein DUI87_07920 [Hirundo rustica rustica]
MPGCSWCRPAQAKAKPIRHGSGVSVIFKKKNKKGIVRNKLYSEKRIVRICEWSNFADTKDKERKTQSDKCTRSSQKSEKHILEKQIPMRDSKAKKSCFPNNAALSVRIECEFDYLGRNKSLGTTDCAYVRRICQHSRTSKIISGRVKAYVWKEKPKAINTE